MKTAIVALFAFASCALLLCAQASVAPMQQLTVVGSSHLLPRSGRGNEPVYEGVPVPDWWPAYSRYQNHRFTSFISANRVDRDGLGNFKTAVAELERIRGAAYRSNNLQADEKQRISQPFNNWAGFHAHQQTPAGIRVARQNYQQDVTKLQELHNVLARFAPRF